MLASLALAGCLIQRSNCHPTMSGHPALKTGWRSEMDSAKGWRPIEMENKPKVQAKEGQLVLSLGQVPNNFPYDYQWSGVWQDLTVDVGKFPAAMASVSNVHGYAHLDIDVLDADKRSIKTIRSSTLTSDGLSIADLSQSLDPATYHLRIRCIVGGPNSGCSASYSWIRFYKKSDANQVRFLDK